MPNAVIDDSRLVNALAALQGWDDTPAACPFGCFSDLPVQPHSTPDAGAASVNAEASHAQQNTTPADGTATMSGGVPVPNASSAAFVPSSTSRFAVTPGADSQAQHRYTHPHFRRLRAHRERTDPRIAAERLLNPAAGVTVTPCFLEGWRAIPSSDSAGDGIPRVDGLLSTSALLSDPSSCSYGAELRYRSLLASEAFDPSRNRTGNDEPAPVLNKRERAMAAMRSVVSQNKIRFQEDGFDLDLTYITPRIIAMGFPSTGRESYWRNPMVEVERFFAKRHPGHFRIYNLCRERDYDAPTRFNGSHRRFPFDDHNAPNDIHLIPNFIRDATGFLKEDDDNVVAIHCKAGKGRTGLMVSCLLMATDPKLREAQAALDYFSDVRTNDSQGVTIPSQMRYVRYWGTMMDHFSGSGPPQVRTLYVNRIVLHSLIKPKATAPLDIYFTVTANAEGEVFDGRKSTLGVSGAKLYDAARKAYVWDFVGSTASREMNDAEFAAANQGNQTLSPRVLALPLIGDVRFTFYARNKLIADEELVHFWLNSTLCDYPQQHITKFELDGASKDKKHRDYHPELAIDMIFEAPEWQVMLSKDKGAAQKTAGAPEAKKKGFFSRVFGSK
jgi:phosphatidylinositol-3,4,5-trisphosphate 3-phosphatase/dual-specificity protein phosphatase PTEN